MNDKVLSPEEAVGNDAESRALHVDLEAAWEADRLRLEIDLSLLAWTLCYEAEPFDLRREIWWPDDIDLACHPSLCWLAERDPTFYDLGRAQLAATFSGFVGVDETDEFLVRDIREHLALAASILQTERPNRRGKYGDHLGRDFLICSVLRAGALADCLWGLDVKPNRDDPFAARTSVAEASEHLADLLNLHPLLSELPDAIPSAETIRAVWYHLGKRTDWPISG